MGLKVLIVDDYPDSARMLSLLLGKEGHSCRVARDGPSAIEAAEVFQPDAVLLDIGLPQMDGHQVARTLRRNGCRSLLVALTGYSGEEELTLSRAAGFDEHLVKPIEFTELDAGPLPSRSARRRGEPAGGRPPAGLPEDRIRLIPPRGRTRRAPRATSRGGRAAVHAAPASSRESP